MLDTHWLPASFSAYRLVRTGFVQKPRERLLMPSLQLLTVAKTAVEKCSYWRSDQPMPSETINDSIQFRGQPIIVAQFVAQCAQYRLQVLNLIITYQSGDGAQSPFS